MQVVSRVQKVNSFLVCFEILKTVTDQSHFPGYDAVYSGSFPTFSTHIDRGSEFLQNARKLVPDHKAWHPTRQHSFPFILRRWLNRAVTATVLEHRQETARYRHGKRANTTQHDVRIHACLVSSSPGGGRFTREKRTAHNLTVGLQFTANRSFTKRFHLQQFYSRLYL
jgi:hypothetical protein